jgi:hypothetical protein
MILPLMGTGCAEAPLEIHKKLQNDVPLEMRKVPYVKVVTPSLRIEAVDGSFVLEPGKPTPTPKAFGKAVWFELITTYSSGSSKDVKRKLGVSLAGRNTPWECGAGFCIRKLDSPIHRVSRALKRGAIRVKIHSDDRTTPLHGVLWFGKAPRGAFGPESRSHAISISSDYLRAASGGRLSVVYEKIRFKYSQQENAPVGEVYGWIIWLSDVPLR